MRRLTVIGVIFLMVLVTAFGGTVDKAAAETYTYSSSFSEPVTIPNNDFNGIELTINVPCSFNIIDMSVTLNIEHEWVGDLAVLVESPTGAYLWLLDQPEDNANELGEIYWDDPEWVTECWTYTFTDSAGQYLPFEDNPNLWENILSGDYLPDDLAATFASSFGGSNAIGEWKLYLCDYNELYEDDPYWGELCNWQLDFEGEPASILQGDFEPDGDVDGSDLAVFAAGGTGMSLHEFAKNLGKTDCL